MGRTSLMDRPKEYTVKVKMHPRYYTPPMSIVFF